MRQVLDTRGGWIWPSGGYEGQLGCFFDTANHKGLYLYGNISSGVRGLYDSDNSGVIGLTNDYTAFFSFKQLGYGYVNGRDVAPFQAKGVSNLIESGAWNYYASFFPALTRKTHKGSWELGSLIPGTNALSAPSNGNYATADYKDAGEYHIGEAFVFSYCKDADYNANNNSTMQVRIFNDGFIQCSNIVAWNCYGTAEPSGTGMNGQIYFRVIS